MILTGSSRNWPFFYIFRISTSVIHKWTLPLPVGITLAKAASLRGNLNLDGTPITSRTHTHPTHSCVGCYCICVCFLAGADERTRFLCVGTECAVKGAFYGDGELGAWPDTGHVRDAKYTLCDAAFPDGYHSICHLGLLYHYRVLFDNFLRSSCELFYSDAKKPSQMVGNVSFTLDPYNDPTSQQNKY